MERTAWNLFRTFFWIGAFTFGGGYAMVPVVRKELVEKQHVLTDEDFVDAMSVIQGAPGAMAVNLATFCGNRLSGAAGAAAATLGAAMPSYLVLLGIAALFNNVADSQVLKAVFLGARPAILALMASAAYGFARTCWRRPNDVATSAVALFALVVLKVHPAVVVGMTAVIGALMPVLGVSRCSR